MIISKREKSHNKIVNFEVENLEHLGCKVENLCVEWIKNHENNIDQNNIAQKI